MAIDVQAFNPIQHITKIKTKRGPADYLAVQWRLVWFRDKCAEGEIETSLVHFDLEKGLAVFKATITDGHGAMATGHGSETKQDFDDYLEKAETKAIGRALAALGYGTQFAPELEEGERIVDSPVSRPAQPLRNGDGSEAVPAINPTVVRMTEIAQARAQKLGIDWDLFKVSTLGVQVHDSKLGMHHFSKINGELTKREKETAKAATSGK